MGLEVGAEALATAVAHARTAVFPADVALPLGVLSTKGADLDLDEGDAETVLFLSRGGLGRDADRPVGDAEAGPALRRGAFGEDNVRGEPGLDERHGVQPVEEAPHDGAAPELGEGIAQIEHCGEFAGDEDIIVGFVVKVPALHDDFGQVVALQEAGVVPAGRDNVLVHLCPYAVLGLEDHILHDGGVADVRLGPEAEDQVVGFVDLALESSPHIIRVKTVG